MNEHQLNTLCKLLDDKPSPLEEKAQYFDQCMSELQRRKRPLSSLPPRKEALQMAILVPLKELGLQMTYAVYKKSFRLDVKCSLGSISKVQQFQKRRKPCLSFLKKLKWGLVDMSRYKSNWWCWTFDCYSWLLEFYLVDQLIETRTDLLSPPVQFAQWAPVHHRSVCPSVRLFTHWHTCSLSRVSKSALCLWLFTGSCLRVLVRVVRSNPSPNSVMSSFVELSKSFQAKVKSSKSARWFKSYSHLKISVCVANIMWAAQLEKHCSKTALKMFFFFWFGNCF